MSREDLVKDYVETQPKLVRHFAQGFLVNAIKTNVTDAITNFGNRSQYINSALQNIDKLKPTSVFNQGVKDDASKTYAKYLGDSTNQDEDLDDQDEDLDDQDVDLDDQDVDLGDQDVDPVTPIVPVVDEPIVDVPVVDEPIVDEPIVDVPVVDEPIVDEPEEEITAEIAKEEEIRVDKTVKATVGDQNVFLNIGNTAYTLDGKLVSFVLTKPTIEKNDFVDSTYKSGDLFTLATPIDL